MSTLQRGYLAIALAALLSHAVCLSAGFIWLDHAHLEEGLALAPARGWGALFMGGFAGTGYYRPLMSVSLSLDSFLGGAPLVYHATTLLWHSAAAIMVAVAGQGLGLSRRVAAGAGVLFAVHPITAVVANAIAFRSEAMLAALLLGLVSSHLKGKAWASAAFLCAAALSKETGLVLGPLFVLSLDAFGPRPVRVPWRERLPLWGAESLALGVAGGLRLLFAPAWRAVFPSLSLDQALGTRLASLTKSVLSLLVPVDVGVCDAFPVTSAAAPTALVGFALLAGLGYWVWRRRGPALLLALALLPSLQLVPVMRWWSPHYLYLPLAFAAMLAVEAVERYRPAALRWLPPVALALGGLTLLDSRRYESDQRFWTKEARLEPACREANFYLGEAALVDKRYGDAAQHYGRALVPKPGVLSYVDLAATLQNLGVARLEQGQFQAAAQAFRAALGGKLDQEARRRLSQNLAVAELLGAREASQRAPR